jgi:PAS domain S-box-containing protein
MSIADFLLALGDRLRDLTDPREVMAAVAEMLGRRLGVGRAGYGETDGSEKFFAVERDWTDGVMPSFIGRHRLDDFGPIIRELRAGRAIRLDDALADPRTAAAGVAAAFAVIGMRAGISVPFMKGGRLVAALYAHQAEARDWRDDDLALMQEVAERTWEAVGRARAETALRESEAKLRDVLEGIGEAFYALDQDLCFLHVSRQALELWGKNAVDLIGRPFIEVFPHAEGTPAYEAHGRVLRTGEAEHFAILSPLLGRWFEVDIHPSTTGLSVAFRDIERRKQAEAALRESEARLQAAIDLVGLSPYSWDLEAGLPRWDARIKAMWGLRPEAKVDLGLARSAIHPDDRPRFEAAVARATDPRGTGVYQAEYRVIGIEDGVERWVSSYGRTTFVNGRATGFIGAVLDITARKRAEERLRASEEWFRRLANLVPAVIWFADADGRVLYINDRWYEYTGQTPEQALSDRTMEAAHPDDVGRMLATWEMMSRRGLACEIEFRCRRRDGAYRWYMARLEPLHDEGGPITGWFGASTDIHDRKLAEEALRESEERFRLFAEHSTNVLWIIDAESGRIEYLSPVFKRVWGEPPGTMLRQHWRRWAETVHPDDRDRAVDAMERSLRGETVAQEYRIIRPDGTVRWLQDALFPIPDEQGRVRRAGGIVQDVTRYEGSLIYVVDGSEASRQELSLLLQGSGYQVKVFASVRAFLDVVPALVPGCVLLDVRTPEAGGLTVPRELKARRINLPVIVMDECHGDAGAGVQAMKAGAVDFLEMPFKRDAILAAVASALAGIREDTDRDHAADLARGRVAGLSAREREVLDGLLAGGTNKTIAKDLGISPRTVEVYRAHVMERLGVHTLPEAVLVAVAAGLRPPASGGGDGT